MSEVISDIIGIEDFATILGVSEKTARRHYKKWPHRTLGRRIIFSKRAILDALSSPAEDKPKRGKVKMNPAIDF